MIKKNKNFYITCASLAFLIAVTPDATAMDKRDKERAGISKLRDHNYYKAELRNLEESTVRIHKVVDRILVEFKRNREEYYRLTRDRGMMASKVGTGGKAKIEQQKLAQEEEATFNLLVEEYRKGNSYVSLEVARKKVHEEQVRIMNQQIEGKRKQEEQNRQEIEGRERQEREKQERERNEKEQRENFERLRRQKKEYPVVQVDENLVEFYQNEYHLSRERAIEKIFEDQEQAGEEEALRQSAKEAVEEKARRQQKETTERDRQEEPRRQFVKETNEEKAQRQREEQNRKEMEESVEDQAKREANERKGERQRQYNNILERSTPQDARQYYYQAALDMLEITKPANQVDQSDAKKAYFTMSRLYHPDKNPNNPKAQEKFTEVNLAYKYMVLYLKPLDQKKAEDFSALDEGW